MYTVQVIGLVYFNVCSVGKRMGWAPNGTHPSQDIAPHHASFFVEPEHYARSSWWDTQTFKHTVQIVSDDGGKIVDKQLLEFRIPEPAEIHFPVLRGDAPNIDNLDSGLPQLEQIDPNFQLDEEHADAIARMPVQGGSLHAFAFEEFPVVQWRFANTHKTFTIEATAGGETRTITVRGSGGPLGTEVVFANTEELIDPPAAEPDGSHFRLYAKLSKSRNPAGLTPPTELRAGLQPLPGNHTYLRFLSAKMEELPATECGPTCC